MALLPLVSPRLAPVRRVLLTTLIVLSASVSSSADIIVSPQYQGIHPQVHNASGTQVVHPAIPGRVFASDASAYATIGFYLWDANPQTDPLDERLTVFISLYKGSGTTGDLLASRPITLSEGFFNFADADFSDVGLTIGNLYTATVAEPLGIWPSGRWFMFFTPNGITDPYFRALTGPIDPLPFPPELPPFVPDNGTTAELLGAALIAMIYGRRKFTRV